MLRIRLDPDPQHLDNDCTLYNSADSMETWNVYLIAVEYRVSDYKFQKSIRVSISNTDFEVSEYRISNTGKSIGCPALIFSYKNQTKMKQTGSC
jgi:hypothetical protein